MKTRTRTNIIDAILWLFIVALLLAGLTSCTKRLYVPVTSTKTIIDTIVKVQPDSSMFMALFECDSLNRVRIKELEQYKGKEASQNVEFKDNRLTVETRWKTQYIDRIKEVHDTTTVIQEVEVVKTVKHIPTLFWWTFGIAIVAILYLGFKVFRR